MHRQISQLREGDQAEQQPQRAHHQSPHQQRAAVGAAQESGLRQVRQYQVRFASRVGLGERRSR